VQRPKTLVEPSHWSQPPAGGVGVVRPLTDSETASAGGQRRRDGQEELVGLLERGAVAVGDPPDVVVIAATVANARRVQKGRAPHYHQLPQRRRRLGALILDQISRGLGGAVNAERSANEIDRDYWPVFGAGTDTQAHGCHLSLLAGMLRERGRYSYRDGDSLI